ncbi:DUF1269 domain-containing protein [Ilumatobacter sp.]|uniref:DUF1269 domain-containing protein n=1 Tax=Ilumatobacter sp. TaxID=1967498 RepID=UPI003B526CBF
MTSEGSVPTPDAPTGSGDPSSSSAFDPPDPSLRIGLDDSSRAVSDPDAPVIIGVSFDSPLKAQEYLLAMSRLRSDGALDLKDAVTVTKDADGGVNVTETIDPTPGRAALSGGMWIGLLGLFVGGPVGWLAGIGIGAGAGAVAAKVIDLGIPDEWVAWFEDAVSPSTSTIVILAEHVHVRALADEAERFQGARLLYTSMSDSAVDQLSDAFGDTG